MLSNKDPSEKITVTFDFSALTTSVTLPIFTIQSDSGPVDPSPSSILWGSPQIIGATVLQKIIGGLGHTYYGIRCQVTAADGSIYVQDDVLPVL